MKTGVTKFWFKQVKEEHAGLPPRLFGGAYGLWIDLPKSMKGDIDNRIKLLSDMLCEKAETEGTFGLGIVKDDKDMHALYVGRMRFPAHDRCAATVVIFQDWPAYVALRLGF